jgi:hypothetical protein
VTKLSTELNKVERDRVIIDLRRKGLTIDEIVAELSAQHSIVVSRTTIHDICSRHLKRANEELEASRDSFRAEIMERYQALLAASWQWALGGSARHIAEARHIIGDMADLMGVKAPIRHEFGESDVDRLLREALDEVERRAALAGQQATDVQADPDRPGAAE